MTESELDVPALLAEVRRERARAEAWKSAAEALERESDAWLGDDDATHDHRALELASAKKLAAANAVEADIDYNGGTGVHSVEKTHERPEKLRHLFSICSSYSDDLEDDMILVPRETCLVLLDRIEVLQELLQEWKDADIDPETGRCEKDWGDFEMRVDEIIKNE